MARHVYSYRIKLKGSEKHERRQAKRQRRQAKRQRRQAKRQRRQAKRQRHQDVQLVLRILTVLWASKGKNIARTAELLECCEQTVLDWRERFQERAFEVERWAISTS